MLGHFIEFQCLHMRQRLRVGNSRDRLDDGVRASADDDVGSAKLSPRPIWKRHFQSPRANEASDAEDQLRAATLEILRRLPESLRQPPRFDPGDPAAPTTRA